MKRLGDIVGSLLVVGIFGGLAWGFAETDWPAGFRLAASCACAFAGVVALAIDAGGEKSGGE